MKKLSPFQKKVLDGLWKAWNEKWDNTPEEEREGLYVSAFPGRYFLNLSGAHSYLYAPYPTIFALEDAGYLKRESVTTTSSELRKGYFGRWIGGTVTYTEVSYRLIPLYHSHQRPG